MQNSLFDSSAILNTGNSLSEEQFKLIVYDKLQDILKRTFPDNKEKQRIKVTRDTFMFACPLCHDSATVNSKKRGNIIFKEGPFHNGYKCHNCYTYMPLSKFFQKFDEELPLNVIEYIAKNKPKTNIPTKQISEFRDSVFNKSEIEKLGVSKQYLIQNFGLLPITEGTVPYKYLSNRCIRNFDNMLYDSNTNAILFLNCVDDNVVSFQIRNITPGYKGQKYITVSLKDIHTKLLKDDKEIPDDLNSLSMIYNLYNINPKKPILATEGPIDSLFLPNCIAILGASKSVNIGLPLWYVYDCDETGKKVSIEKLEKGCNVFMWSKLKKTYNLPVKKKWDINDFVIWCNKYGKDLPRYWNIYFSNDSLDILDI